MSAPAPALLRRAFATLIAALAVLAPATAATAATAATPMPGDEAGAPIRVEPAPAASIANRAAVLVERMEAREKAAAIVMAHTPGTDPAALAAFMRDTGAGGFIVMGANVAPDPAAMRALTAALTVDPALPPLIGIDQEGGDVRRLRTDTLPSSLTLKNEAPDAVARAFSGRGAQVRAAGVDVNFGIVADYASDPSSFIFRRSLGTNPETSAERVAAAVLGEAPFVASTLKHFPGHGAAPGDSHHVIPTTGMTLDQWRSGESLPFRAGIDAGAELVMFGHLAYTAVDPAPASLSAEWHRILREELGFAGVAVTDDMAMLEASDRPDLQDPVANAVAAVAAGNDLVLGVSYTTPERANAVIDGIAEAAASGALPAERLDDAAMRVVELRLRWATGPGAVRCDVCEPAA